MSQICALEAVDELILPSGRLAKSKVSLEPLIALLEKIVQTQTIKRKAGSRHGSVHRANSSGLHVTQKTPV